MQCQSTSERITTERKATGQILQGQYDAAQRWGTTRMTIRERAARTGSRIRAASPTRPLARTAPERCEQRFEMYHSHWRVGLIRHRPVPQTGEYDDLISRAPSGCATTTVPLQCSDIEIIDNRWKRITGTYTLSKASAVAILPSHCVAM